MATTIHDPAEIQRGATPTNERRRTRWRHFARALLAITTVLGGLVLTAGPASADHHGIAPAPVTCAEQIRPLLRSPSTHECVASLQHFLKSIAFISGIPHLNPGPIDAHFGPQTTSAVRAYQSLKGLQQDGQVGGRTWTVIGDDCAIFYSLGVGNVCHTQVRY